MNSAKTLHFQEGNCPLRTRSCLDFLDAELLSAERGEQPHLDRVLRTLDVISNEARSSSAVEQLCQGLRAFIADLREDGLALALEDLDLLLISSGRIRELLEESQTDPAHGVERAEPADPATSPVMQRPLLHDLESIEFAPEFLDSGLVAEASNREIRIRLPNLVDNLRITRVVADLEDLWSRTPSDLPWRLDLCALERIPVAILASLAKLRASEGAESRLLRLNGELSTLQSEALTDSLASYVQLV